MHKQQYTIQQSLLFLLLLLSNHVVGQTFTSLQGRITNPTGDSVFIYMVKPDSTHSSYDQFDLGSTRLDQEGRFAFSFLLNEPGIIRFYDGNEVTSLFMLPGDDLYMTLNTKYFDETIQYYGKGAERNNTIVDLSLIHETFMLKYQYGLQFGRDSASLIESLTEAGRGYLQLIDDYLHNDPDFAVMADELKSKHIDDINQEKKYFGYHHRLLKLKNTPAIAFRGEGMNGEALDLHTYKGKPVVVDFWATWCGPCHREMPSFKILEEKYGDKVHFVSVALYSERDKWREMAGEFGLKNNLFLDPEASKQIIEYDVRIVPRYMLISADFIILDGDARRPSDPRLEKQLQALISTGK